MKKRRLGQYTTIYDNNNNNNISSKNKQFMYHIKFLYLIFIVYK